MKIAIISDIHGNAAALREVFKSIDKSECDTIISLGDNIGYGPEPAEVIQLLIKRNIPSILGNHELAINQPEFLNWFNPTAKISLEKTKDMLGPDELAYTAALPRYHVMGDCRFVHGFPPDSATLYLFELRPEQIIETMDQIQEAICFVGHTHELVLIEINDQEVTRRQLKRETLELDPGKKYIINAGSVGQPRDGNNYAKYMIFDDVSFELQVCFVPYNITETVSKIYQVGLPEQHAWRLL